MKKYLVKIEGMHCTACRILISEELEEYGFKNVEVSVEGGIAIFESADDKDNVEKQVNEIFSKLDGYKVVEISRI